MSARGGVTRRRSFRAAFLHGSTAKCLCSTVGRALTPVGQTVGTVNECAACGNIPVASDGVISPVECPELPAQRNQQPTACLPHSNAKSCYSKKRNREICNALFRQSAH